jgi:hypothetical protein
MGGESESGQKRGQKKPSRMSAVAGFCRKFATKPHETAYMTLQMPDIADLGAIH